MNWRLGLFRGWVLVAVMWAAFMLIISYEQWKPDLDILLWGTRDWPVEVQLPVPCEQAAGTPQRSLVNGVEHCFHPMSEFRTLYPEYQGIDDETLIARTYARVGIRLGYHYDNLKWAALSASLPPLFLLGLGFAMAWVMRGFRRA